MQVTVQLKIKKTTLKFTIRSQKNTLHYTLSLPFSVIV